VFFGNSEISIKKITDGTSKTFAVGERDKFCLAATWIGVRNPYGPDMWSSNWALAHVFLKLNHPITGAHQNSCTEAFSSAHPGGGFFAFCDGSVRFISDDISFDTISNQDDCYAPPYTSKPCVVKDGTALIGIYQRLAWRNDGLEVDGASN
jgi:prepilin-type processing-associated H-X9-DG protein